MIQIVLIVIAAVVCVYGLIHASRAKFLHPSECADYNRELKTEDLMKSILKVHAFKEYVCEYVCRSAIRELSIANNRVVKITPSDLGHKDIVLECYDRNHSAVPISTTSGCIGDLYHMLSTRDVTDNLTTDGGYLTICVLTTTKISPPLCRVRITSNVIGIEVNHELSGSTLKPETMEPLNIKSIKAHNTKPVKHDSKRDIAEALAKSIARTCDIDGPKSNVRSSNARRTYCTFALDFQKAKRRYGMHRVLSLIDVLNPLSPFDHDLHDFLMSYDDDLEMSIDVIMDSVSLRNPVYLIKKRKGVRFLFFKGLDRDKVLLTFMENKYEYR